MREFLRSFKFKVLLGVVLLLFCGMFLSAATYGSETATSSLVGMLLSPFQKGANAVSSGVGQFFNGFKRAEDYEQQIAALEGEISDLQGKLADYDQLKHQNEQYEAYLDLKEQNTDFAFLSAEVIASDPADPFSTLTISKGSLDGVKVNDPVIQGNSLVGVVAKVGKTYANINTILNPKVSVGSYETRTRERGVVSGDLKLAQSGKCRMEYLGRDTGILPGSLICTTGAGGVFPRGLLVGQVDTVEDSAYDISAYAVLSPMVDMKEVKDVFVITSFLGQGSGDGDEE